MNALRLFFTMALLACLPAAARAESDILFICDTQEQLEQYVASVKETGDHSIALQFVNAKAEGTVCGPVAVEFERGKEVKRIESAHGTLSVVPVTLLGLYMPNGMMLPVPEKLQYTAFHVTEQGA